MSSESNQIPVSTEPVRPALSFETITFSDGSTLSLEDDEIIVFVGPNNAGKSAALRELQNCISSPQKQNVITETKIRKSGTRNDLLYYLQKKAQKSGEINNLYYGGMGYNIHYSHLDYFDSPANFGPVAPFFSLRLATEDRIVASNAAGPLAVHQSPPTHPIHLLLMDPSLAATISNHFHRAFGKDLFPFRAGGSSFPLMVGSKPEKADGEDEFGKNFVEQVLASTMPLQNQGDGMRSFATVLLHILATDNHSVQFLDEPEAFLHPPQARLLGEYIAKERRAKSQLFIATHSTDILDGLLTAEPKKLRIVRIRRDGAINCVTELSKEQISRVANDPLTRYSGVFRGIFYQHVIVAEADSDCLFYSSLLNTKHISGDQQPDVLFIHTSGKHRMADIVETLKSLDVPVSVIADIDILNEKPAFQKLFEKLNGTWDTVSHHWEALDKAVRALRPPINAEQMKNLILNALSNVHGVGDFPKHVEFEIKNILKSQSPWALIKQAGRSGIKGAPSVKHFDELATKCANVGLWIVQVGELENFCRSIEAKHGPAFVEALLETRDLEADEELEEARKFVKKIWAAARAASGEQLFTTPSRAAGLTA